MAKLSQLDDASCKPCLRPQLESRTEPFNIENVIGSASGDTIYGNYLVNDLKGAGGNDIIRGGGGNNTIDGGIGRDTLDYSWITQPGDHGGGLTVFFGVPGNGSIGTVAHSNGFLSDIGTDTVTGIEKIIGGSNADVFDAGLWSYSLEIAGGGGNDTIRDSNTGHTLSGGEGDDTITANGGGDIVNGDNGNDTMTGGSGQDVLRGGAGNDTFQYSLRTDIDLVVRGEIIDGGTGIDTIKMGGTEINFALAAISSIEVVDFRHPQYANQTNRAPFIAAQSLVTAQGTGLSHTLNLIGDLAAPDVLQFHMNDGIDGQLLDMSAYTFVNWTSNVDRVEVIGIDQMDRILGSSKNDYIQGNGGGDTLHGNAGDDTLNGGTGNDIMYGGQGNDIYLVDSTTDLAIEGGTVGSGTDLVIASITLTGLAVNVEQLVLTGANAIIGTGNGIGNFINGSTNTAANVLRGLGSNDVYVLGAGDTVNETVAGSGGIDTVQSALTQTLALNVENLTLTGSAVINGTGNAVANSIGGNTAANTLNGLGGNDAMFGGGGADTFVFNTTPNAASNKDTITDFNVIDTIQLDNAVFASLGAAGAIGGRFFASATGLAHDADDRIIYNTATGALTYDSNGNVAGGTIINFATLSTKPVISAADVVVI